MSAAGEGDDRPVTVGIRVPHELFEGNSRALRDGVAAVEAAGIDRVCGGDHVSFHGGRGFDGLIQATAMAALCELEVQTAVYLLPLRHPVPVARQVNSLAQMARGRFIFGVGVGGEDPKEVWACGIDPATRGRRMDESIGIVRALLSGETVSRSGGFYELSDVTIWPPLAVPVPIVIGGRSEAALRRAGRLGDGFLALWSTPDKFIEALDKVHAYAAEAGRTDVTWRHGLQAWCGFGETAAVARPLLAKQMESLYRTPFEKFERYAPHGTPADVAAAFAPYVQAGCREINLIPVAASPNVATAAAGEVRRLLRQVR